MKYDDILELPHHVSDRHPRMPVADRAAQFSPFSALTGYDDIIEETGRLTDFQTELDDMEKGILNEKLRRIGEKAEENPQITVIWFRRDDRKSGGAYVSYTGCVKKVDQNQQAVFFTDGTVISFSSLCHIETDG